MEEIRGYDNWKLTAPEDDLRISAMRRRQARIYEEEEHGDQGFTYKPKRNNGNDA